jgi:glycosyltransferase involved in cell wall biosynthesis
VVPNGLDDKPFAEARGRQVEQNQPDALKRILFVGLMCPEKGFRDVIRAIPLVPEAQFIFAGEWPSPQDEEEVRFFLKKNDAERRVQFAGVVSGAAKYDLFASADIFVFPTYFVYEGHAVSSVEALAARLPIVCTDHGALNESVSDGWNGYFVPRSDPNAIANRLNQLVRDDTLRKTMGERSRRRYEERFTLKHFTDNWTRAILTGTTTGAGIT